MTSLWIVLLAGLLQAAQPPEAAVERENLTRLVTVKRIYVDRLNGGETAGQMRDMIISSLERSKMFVITENPERCDATLRGSAEDLVFTDTFSSSEGINARANAGMSEGGQTTAKNRHAAYGGIGVGETESLHTQERKHEASASVRLVNKDGDVIWSTTQESLGGRFRGASADVADKITRQLSSDLDRARRWASSVGQTPVPAAPVSSRPIDQESSTNSPTE